MNSKEFFKKSPLALSLYLIIFNTLSFLPVLKCALTNWDDNITLSKNPLVTNLSWQGILDIFSSFTNGSYIPLTILSFTFEFHFVQLNPFLYHLDNLVLHIANALLVFWLINMISRRPLLAFIVTLLFSLNPLRVESVAWISARKDLLSSFFLLSSLIAYIQYITSSTRSTIKLSLSLVCYIFACLAKPQALILPLILPVLDYFFDRQTTKSTRIEKILFLGIMILFVVIGQKSLSPLLSEQTFHNVFTPLDKFFLTISSIIFYIIQTLAPAQLSCLYPYPLKTGQYFPVGVYLSPLLIGGLGIFLFKRFPKDKHVLFAVLFFTITLSLPLLNIALGGYFANDRYMYLPSIGLFYGLAHVLAHYYSAAIKTFKTWSVILISLYLLFFSVMSFTKSLVWKNDITLWSDALEYNPQLPIAYNNRGSFYMEVQQISLALKDLNKAIGLAPHYQEAYYNRALIYTDTMQYPLAIKDFEKILQLNPNHVEAYNNRGYIYYQLGDYSKGLSDFNMALSIKTDHESSLFNRAVCHFALRDYGSSLNDLNKVLKNNPSHPEAQRIKQRIEQLIKTSSE